MNVLLWVLQGLLALAFGMAGGMKLFTPIDQLVANGMGLAADAPMLVRFIGLSEFLGAVGLILPSALKIQPKLTPIAAALLAVVMVLAAGTHIMMNDLPGLGAPIVLGLMCAFVAWGRALKAPIAARG